MMPRLIGEARRLRARPDAPVAFREIDLPRFAEKRRPPLEGALAERHLLEGRDGAEVRQPTLAELAAKGCAKAVALRKWKDNIRKNWSAIRINDVQISQKPGGSVLVGDTLEVVANIQLGPIAPDYVTVQAYVGEAVNNEITRPGTFDLVKDKKLDEHNWLYRGSIPARESGSYGLNVRVIPTHPNLTQAHELRLITWAK